MTKASIAKLDDRGVLCVAGPDAVKFLQGLITNDIEGLNAAPEKSAFDADAVHTALLSPQGKILFEFFCVRTADGFLLETAREKAGELAKRLAMYKLRAAIEITNASDDYTVFALWGPHACSSGPTAGTIAFRDPRHRGLGMRILAEARFAADVASATNGSMQPAEAFHAHRIALDVPEGGKDYDFGDAYPHEADFDIFHGVSFTKGCYVGQEIVARMQHKTVVRKRVVPVTGASDLPHDRPEIIAAGLIAGRLGSVSGARGLALLRLDRAAEAEAQGQSLTAAGITLSIDPPAWLKMPAAAKPAQP